MRTHQRTPSGELILAAATAPLMIAGLAVTAAAAGWQDRLPAAGMVLGGAIALGASGRRARVAGWAVAAVTAAALLALRF